ncbi:MAG: pilus assembly protein [Aquificaceae bacterium]
MKRLIYTLLLLIFVNISQAQVIREMKFENVKLETVLKALSEVSQMNLLFDPAISQDLQKTVSISIYKPVPVGEAFNIILKENNLIAVPVDAKVYRITKAGSISISVADLEDRDIREILNFLKARVSPSAEIVLDKTLKTIYVRDEEANIKQLEPILRNYRRLAQTLVPREEVQTKVFYLRFIDLDEAEKRIKTSTTQETNITKAYDFNAIIIRDTPKKLAEYESILRPFLTTTPTERRPVTKIFYLKYVSPEEFIKLIEPYRSEAGLILSGGAERVQQQAIQQQAQQQQQAPQQQAGQTQASLAPTPIIREFNAVMVTDYPDVLQRIKEIFKEYISDTPVRISIEARIVEISSETLRELGINWNVLLSQARVQEFWQGGAGANMGLPPNPAGSPILIPGLSPNAGGIFVFTYQKGILNALNFRISALERINKAKSIAKPMVVAINGQKATIRQGIQVPYLTAAPGAGGTAVQNVQFKDVVLELDVTPVVSPDGRILIDLALKRDTIGVQTPQGPAINTKEVKTKVVVESGQTVVLGGVIDSQDTQTNEGIPGIIRVPLLKYLFGQERINQSDRELLIFITPTLVTQ